MVEKKDLSLVENYKYLDTISEAITSYKKSASSLGAFLQNLKDDIRMWDESVVSWVWFLNVNTIN